MEIKRGDIVYVDLNPVEGNEQGGCRPCVVLQNNLGNMKSTTTIIAPISKADKKPMPTHVRFVGQGLSCTVMNTIMLEQIRTVSASRLGEVRGHLDKETMKKVNEAMEISLGLRRVFQ